MPTESRLVRCTLRDVNGGGVVFVPPEDCERLRGTNKGAATAAEEVNWRENTRLELERLLANLPADLAPADDTRAIYEAGIKDFG